MMKTLCFRGKLLNRMILHFPLSRTSSRRLEGLSQEEMLEDVIRYQRSDLINQYENVVVDGLSGFAYTISTEGDSYGKDHKQTVVYLLDGDFYFQFVYDDLSDEYAKRLEDFRKHSKLLCIMVNNLQKKREHIIFRIFPRSMKTFDTICTNRKLPHSPAKIF